VSDDFPASRLLENDVDVDLKRRNPDELRLSMPLRGNVVFAGRSYASTRKPCRHLHADRLAVNCNPLRPDSPAVAGLVQAIAITDRAGRSVMPNRASNSVLVTVQPSPARNDAPNCEPPTHRRRSTRTGRRPSTCSLTTRTSTESFSRIRSRFRSPDAPRSADRDRQTTNERSTYNTVHRVPGFDESGNTVLERPSVRSVTKAGSQSVPNAAPTVYATT